MKSFLQSHWKFVLALNLMLGIFLWFSSFTNISLQGTIPDILFPPVVFILALVTLGVLPSETKIIGRLLYVPSLLGGFLYILMGFIMIIPPFTLAFLFSLDEIASEVQIQQVASPNNMDFAEVYFRPVGAYTGGSGRIYIRVVNKFLPFIERDVYAGKTYTADEKATNVIKWLGNDTLVIAETNEQISIGNIKPELPSLSFVPLIVIGFVQGQIRESQLTAPLSNIPIYPAHRENESTGYWDISQTSERIYFLPQAQIKEVYDWHLSSLSEQPWQITDSQIVPNTDPAYQGQNAYVYCITALKRDDNQTTVYYFEIAELYTLVEPDYRSINPDLWDVRVIAATPNPDSIYCWLK